MKPLQTMAGVGLMWLASCATPQPIADGPWTQAASMPTARSELAAAVLDDRIYVAGGLRLGPTAAFAVYDPAADTWRALAPLPVAVHHLAMAAAGGRIYVTGGYDSLFFRADRRSTWAYDPHTDRWTMVADMPAPRAAHAMVAIDDTLYVIGGVGPDPTALWAYDPGNDRWDTSRKPLPTAREHLTAAVVNGMLYVIGGRWEDAGNLATVEAYDPATDRWTRKRDMPTARGGLTAAAVAGRVHVTGGEILSFPGRTFGEHEVYDPGSDTWTTLEPLPTPRHGLASAAIGERWYVIGGATQAGVLTPVSLSDRVEVYTPSYR